MIDHDSFVVLCLCSICHVLLAGFLTEFLTSAALMTDYHVLKFNKDFGILNRTGFHVVAAEKFLYINIAKRGSTCHTKVELAVRAAVKTGLSYVIALNIS